MNNTSASAIQAHDRARLKEIDDLSQSRDIGALLERLADRSWLVRRHAIAALSGFGDAALPELGRLLREQRTDENLIAAVVDTLAASEGDVESMLSDLARDPNPAVVSDAAQILGRRRARSRVELLAELTGHPDDNVAVSALEALGRIGGRAAVEALARAVDTGNFFRVYPAIDVLGRSGDPRAIPALAKLVDDSRYMPEAARALGRTGDRGAIAPLVTLLHRPSDASVRVAALSLAELLNRHLELYGSEGLEGALRTSSGTKAVRRLASALSNADAAEQAAICRVLGALRDDSAAPVLTRLLNAPVPAVATAAAEALRRLSREADARLVDSLRDGDSEQRRALLPLLATRFRAAERIAECLDDRDPGVRSLTCDVLARIGNPSVVPRLFEALRDNHPGVVHAAIGAIQALGSAQTEELALKAVQSENPQVKRAALRIITYFGYSSALDLLLETVRSEDERLRDIAINGLPFLEHGRAIDALLEAARHPNASTRTSAMRALAQCSHDVRTAAYLLRGLSDQDPWVRYYACRSLGRLGWAGAIESVSNLLDDEAGQVRVAAVEALSHLGGQQAFEALSKSANSEDPDVRRAALLGLGIGGWSEAVPVIVAAVESSDASTRLIALSALAGFDDAAAHNALTRAALDPEESVRNAAVGFLAARTSLEATRALISLLDRSDQTESIMTALSQATFGRISGLAAALSSADDEVSVYLTSALARMRTEPAVSALINAARSPNVAARKAALTTLAAIGTPRTLEVVQQAAASDADVEVRRICSLVLAQGS